MNDDTYWAPAIRSGPNWKHNLQIYLRRKYRVTRIAISYPDTAVARYKSFVKIAVTDNKSFRSPKGVSIHVSMDGTSWKLAKYTG